MLPRLQDDFLALLFACATGAMPETRPRLSSDAALTVVIAAKGYPAAPLKGAVIGALEAAKGPGVIVTQAGTKEVDGHLVADGGRVLNVTGLGPTIAAAQQRAYAAVSLVAWPDGVFRRDIGARAMSPSAE